MAPRDAGSRVVLTLEVDDVDEAVRSCIEGGLSKGAHGPTVGIRTANPRSDGYILEIARKIDTSGRP